MMDKKMCIIKETPQIVFDKPPPQPIIPKAISYPLLEVETVEVCELQVMVLKLFRLLDRSHCWSLIIIKPSNQRNF
jgi:hypothetical protein